MGQYWITVTRDQGARTLTVPRAWSLQEAADLAEHIWEQEGEAADVRLMGALAGCVCRFPPQNEKPPPG